MKEIMGVRLLRIVVVFGIWGSLVATGCGEDTVLLKKVSGDDQDGQTGLELPIAVAVRVQDEEGNGIKGATVEFAVTAGGGTVSSPSEETDSSGLASVRWTLGAAPVWNRVRASSRSKEVEFVAWADPGEGAPLNLVFQGPAGTTAEDLAFREGRGLFLGSPGAILNIPAPGAGAVELDLTGETVEGPAGIAFGPSGDLYACENAPPQKSVKRVQPSGLSEILSVGFRSVPFALPNHMAVHSSGDIYVSSTCDQMIYKISPVDGETTEFLAIPGPNGLAFDAQEAYLYILTENPDVFCYPSPDVRGGLFRVPLDPGGEPPDEIEPLVEEFALAGDGLAFDEEGNLYTVFSASLTGGLGRLDDSAVFVYTPDGRFNELFSVNILEGDIITNIAFGVEPFDPYSLYCYGFTGRLYRVEVGIRGQPLP